MRERPIDDFAADVRSSRDGNDVGFSFRDLTIIIRIGWNIECQAGALQVLRIDIADRIKL